MNHIHASPSPRKQPEISQTNNTMPRLAAPKQVLQKKHISDQEYSFREEWAPETVKDYQVFPDKPAPEMAQRRQPQPQQSQPHPQTTTPVNIKGRVANRRSQARSSSLFEEWKAQALHNPVQSKEPNASTAQQKGNNINADGSTTSSEARAPLGDHSDKVANTQAMAKPVNNDRGQQPEASKPGKISEESHAFVLPSGNTSGRGINPAATIRKKESKRGRKQGDRERQQQFQERQQHSREREQEQSMYTAPNGTRIRGDELRKLALGTELKDKDKVYFLPCFIEDPWKGLKSSLSFRPPGLMSRF